MTPEGHIPLSIDYAENREQKNTDDQGEPIPEFFQRKLELQRI